LKILFALPHFEPAVGGVENYVSQIVDRLTPRHEVVVVTTGPEGNGQKGTHPERGYPLYTLPRQFKVFNTPLSRTWLGQLRQIIDTERPDVVNAHMPVPGLADFALRATPELPTVLTYHNDLVKAGLARLAVRGYYNLVGYGTLGRARRVIVTSQHYADQSPYLDQSEVRLDIVPPGVDLERFHPVGPGRHDPTVLFVGNLDHTHSHKGLSILLPALVKVAAEVPAARLIVAGTGDRKAEYERMARELGVADRTDFPGFVADSELPDLYRSARVAVLPSTNAAEGFGMVLLEAQASGTPVIGTRTGGIPAAMVEGTSGLLVDPGSAEQLAGAITSVLSSEETYQRLRQGCRPVATRFSWDETARRTESVLMAAVQPEIVEISTFYPPFLGGLEKVVETMAEGLSRRGQAVRVVTSGTRGRRGADSSQGGPVGLGQADTMPSTAPRIWRLRSFELGGLPVIPGVLPALRRISAPAVFHVHLAQAGLPEMAMLAARRSRSPVFLHVHLDVAPSGRFGRIFALYKAKVLPRTLRRASGVICFSERQRDHISRTYGVDPERIEIVENGVYPVLDRVPSRTYSGPLRVLFVGRLAPQKRLDVLISAVALLPPAERPDVEIVGTGPLEGELQEQARRLELDTVRFLGRLAGDDLAAAYERAHVFVLASEREGMPLALLEAMSAGLAPLASAVEGIVDFVEDGRNGLLFAADSPSALASGLRRLDGDRQLVRRLGVAAVEYASGRTWDRSFDRLEEILAKASSARSGG
jgi:glycosyltransferase involved in cell wall biosynthesis